MDQRWQELAEILVGYSTVVGPGDRVMISMLEIETFPLIRALHAAVIAAGGYPYIEFNSAFLERDLLLHGTDDQISWVPEMAELGMDWADIYIGVRGSSNPSLLFNTPVDRISERRKAMGYISALRTEKTRWVLVRVPGDAMAQQAGIGLDEMMAVFFNSVLRDWQKEAAEYEQIRSLFAGGHQIRIVGPGTDLRFDTTGRHFLLEDGHINMPGGEVYTSPVEESAEGHISFTYPGVFAGRSVTGIELQFSKGEVVAASAKSNQELLERLLAMDEGARRIGEFGIGLNKALEGCYRDPLYDEKVWGTAHLALGRSYSACGGKNRSALHWDIVTDLRDEGEIHVDGRRVFHAGAYATSDQARKR